MSFRELESEFHEGRDGCGFSPQSLPQLPTHLVEGLEQRRPSTKIVLGMAENSFLTLGFSFPICMVKPLDQFWGDFRFSF